MPASRAELIILADRYKACLDTEEKTRIGWKMQHATARLRSHPNWFESDFPCDCDFCLDAQSKMDDKLLAEELVKSGIIADPDC